MNRAHGRWFTRTAAAIGLGALAFATVPLAAAAEGADERNLAVDDSRYDAAAALTGDAVDEVKELEETGVIDVTERGHIYYVDEVDQDRDRETPSQAVAGGAAIPGDPAAGSRPGAPVTVYLDFDGETLEGVEWNRTSNRASLAFTPAATSVDRAAVWAAVAEDFAAFDVNVTTTRPGDGELYKTAPDDARYGSHVIITDSNEEVLPALDGAGVAFLRGAGSRVLSGALVTTRNLGGDTKNVAEAVTHEAGHNFGLDHDGITGTATGPYYTPTLGVWGPIMGTTYDVPVSQWSRGEYAGATNAEDDLSVITDRSSVQRYAPDDYSDRADFAADQVGDDAERATGLDDADAGFHAVGVIERSSDVDVFTVTTGGGELSATVLVADVSPNLDSRLTLTDAAGAVIAVSAPETTRVSRSHADAMGAALTADLPAGTYYLAVDGVGMGDPEAATRIDAHGYSDYGSLGNYSLTGAIAPAAE